MRLGILYPYSACADGPLELLKYQSQQQESGQSWRLQWYLEPLSPIGLIDESYLRFHQAQHLFQLQSNGLRVTTHCTNTNTVAINRNDLLVTQILLFRPDLSIPLLTGPFPVACRYKELGNLPTARQSWF